MRYTASSMLNDLIGRMLRSGWVIKSKTKHVKLFHEETGNTLIVSHSPSCPNTAKQAARDIRRMGLDLCP